jgi:uncharacterized membrane protein YbhN (UPF0104 family)
METAPQPAPRRRTWLRLAIELGVLVLVSAFVWRSVVDACHQLHDYKFQLQPAWLVASGAFYLLGLLPMGIFWFYVLRALGQHAHLAETLRAFYIGHLGKYVPGKALVVILRTGLIHSERVSAGVAAASVFLETLTMMAVGAFLAAVILAGGLHRDIAAQHPYLMPLAAGIIVVSGLPTLPPVFRRLALQFRVGRNDPEIESKLRGVTWRLMIVGWIGVAAGWTLIGWSLWATLRGMGIEGLEPVGHLQYYVAAAALAVVAGFLSLLPGGAVVRELILTAILGIYFSQVVHANPEQANPLVTAVIVRLVWLAAELLLAGVLYVGLRRSP